MSATGLKVWAEKNIRPLRENGVAAEEVKLVAFENTWQTWLRGDFSENVDNWVDEVNSLITSLCEDWPAKHIQCFIEAYDSKGDVFAKYIYNVKGRNKDASAKLYGGEQKAFAESMAAQAKTTRELLDMATQSAAIANSNANALAAQCNNFMIALMQERLSAKEREIELKEERNNTQVQDKVLEQLPGLIELGKMYISTLPQTRGNKILHDALGALEQVTTPNGE